MQITAEGNTLGTRFESRQGICYCVGGFTSVTTAKFQNSKLRQATVSALPISTTITYAVISFRSTQPNIWS
jgi:hypothetical protein